MDLINPVDPAIHLSRINPIGLETPQDLEAYRAWGFRIWGFGRLKCLGPWGVMSYKLKGVRVRLETGFREL